MNAQDPEEEAQDIQGLLLFGYRNWPWSGFALLKINDVAACKAWLAAAVKQTPPLFHTAQVLRKDAPRALNVAFTSRGLRRLGLEDDELRRFSREFFEGMTAPDRQRILGDYEESAPTNWSWGYGENRTPDLMLLMYAEDAPGLQTMYSEHKREFARNGLSEIQWLEGSPLDGQREHFGFRDGIANPTIEGRGAGEQRSSFTLAPGEFVLGYRNQYDRVPFSATVDRQKDQADDLATVSNEPTRKDLGRNGSYLVFRHISQDVYGFWSFLDSSVRKNNANDPARERVTLAAKMVGRWPNGAPLVTHPDSDSPPPPPEKLNDFLYSRTDPEGDRCPFGSHIRRANPRDWLLGSTSVEALKVADRHQVLRRGRTYGPPLCESFDPAEILEKGRDGKERGLFFLCLNTDIARQFEFVQQTWINNPKFAGMYSDPDPLIGAPMNNGQAFFNIPGCPVRRRVAALPQFTTIRGGAYFFMPGVRALRYLSRPSGEI